LQNEVSGALPGPVTIDREGSRDEAIGGATAALANDVARLVIAGRVVAYEVLSPDAPGFTELDVALEAFASRVGWENEPDDDGGEAVHAQAEGGEV
jgi:hypothetical protein